MMNGYGMDTDFSKKQDFHQKSYSLSFIFLCFFTVSYFFSPLFYLGASYARLPMILISLTLLFHLVSCIIKRKKFFYLNISIIILTLFVIFGAYSTYFESVDFYRSKDHFVTLLKIFILYVVISSIIATKRELKFYLLLLNVCIFTVAYRLLYFGYWTGGRVFMEGTAFSGDPNILTMAFVFIIPINIALLLLFRNLSLRLLLLFFLFIIFLAIIEGRSRGGFIALLILAFFGIFQIKGLNKKIIFTIVTFLLVGVFSARYVPPVYIDRMKQIVHTEDDHTGSAQARASAMSVTLEYVKLNPVSKYGLGNHSYHLAEVYGTNIENQDIFRGSYLVHNVFLQIGADMGALPLVIYIFFLYSVFRNLSVAIKQSSLVLKNEKGGYDQYIIAKTLRMSLLALLTAMFFLASAFQPFLYILCGCIGANERLSAVAKDQTS
ncbi:O-antigen ligase family protein [Desulfobulbus alkaliphilus]|uniref:O-antigen ligase family protein n=1 Tax=Desulfobulbus alkaliphilus TaxID=869814 RepID=UPI0019662407|nr:O-antigen ligase family protein [Desulfobulbus alkaliphilus]MBM9538462.1 O-antigen ligase family protein [Desulfobulbus alkaliphilus]